MGQSESRDKAALSIQHTCRIADIRLTPFADSAWDFSQLCAQRAILAYVSISAAVHRPLVRSRPDSLEDTEVTEKTNMSFVSVRSVISVVNQRLPITTRPPLRALAW